MSDSKRMLEELLDELDEELAEELIDLVGSDLEGLEAQQETIKRVDGMSVTFSEEDDDLDDDLPTGKSVSPASKGEILPGAYEVEQGDCVASIAYRAGLTEKVLLQEPGNKALAQGLERGHSLLPGETVQVPARRKRVVARPTGKRHRFRRKDVPARLEVRPLLMSMPRRNVAYEITVDGDVSRAITDGEGWIKRKISPDAARATIVFDPDGERETYEITLGGIDPVSSVTGIQARLENIGYACVLSGEEDAQLALALARYQEDHQLPVTGEIDDTTRASLASSFQDD